MRIFKNAFFTRFAKKEHLLDHDLYEAGIRIQKGQYQGNLGGGVIKLRMLGHGKGKSGGYRTIVLFKKGRSLFFVHGFAKNVRSTISKNELIAFRKLSDLLTAYTDEQLHQATKNGVLFEVKKDE